MIEPNTHLETKFVFLDTEAFVREKFDWNSKALARFQELAASNHVKLLTTIITKTEVRRKLREHLSNAGSALKKYEVLLAQLDAGTTVQRALAPESIEHLDNLFDDFLLKSQAIEIPLDVDITTLFDDYFRQKPPFSEKKKAEFPDAAVVQSIRRWCNRKFCKAYIVSGDPDLKACSDDVLLHAETISEIISKATVTRRIHDELLTFVKENASLNDELHRALRGKKVTVLNPYGGVYHHDIQADGAIYATSNLDVTELNVLTQRSTGFTCEIQFDVQIDIELELSFGSDFFRSGYERGRTYFETESIAVSLTAELGIAFNFLNPFDSEIEELYFDPNIEIGIRELEIYRTLR
ncbi:hypothetical protein V1277_006797 [Bradyrhizobium sp. AZCC 1588]|uniref:PIN domain-containing protein n=1 Tax=unclassified Bradyrhizobium TaxID=2631580 RepID=UPI002FF1CCDC